MAKGFKAKDVAAQAGKCFLVTGANTGLGFETSKVLAAKGARVLMACRNEDKARKAMERKSGARGLRSILEAVLLDTMYQVPSLDGVAKVVIDSATIDGESEPLLIYENSEQTSRVAPD